MITCLVRNFRFRLLLAAALVLSFAARMPAQDFEPMQPVGQGVDPGDLPNAEVPGQGYMPLSPEQLDELLGPVALYPDPLLAQVLAAATYPLDIIRAARFLSTSSDLDQLDQMGLDPSVQALARFPDLLRRMDEDLDWTNALGAAFLNQQQDVMDAVQRLRAAAMSNGVLQDTPQQEIYTEEGYVGIVPADPEVIFVPQYVPAVVYGWSDPPIGGYYSSISFGIGYSTGSWLNLGFNWGNRCVAYRPWPVGPRSFYRGGFGGAYYRSASWGHSWHRRGGSPLPRYRGGHGGFGGGRGFDGHRGGFGHRSGGGPGRQDGSRGGFGNGGRGGPGAGSGNGPRGGQRGGGPSVGFRNGPRADERNGGFAGPRSGGPRNNGGPGNNGPLGGFGNGPRGGQNRGGSPGAVSNGQPRRQGSSSPGGIGNGIGNRSGGNGPGRGPRDGAALGGSRTGSGSSSPGGSFGRGPLNRSGGGNGLQGGGRPNRSGGNPGNSIGGGRSRGEGGPPRAFRGSSQGGGSSPRSLGSGGPRGGRGMPGISGGGGRPSGGRAFRGGGQGPSGPRMQSNSGGRSVRSPGGSSPRGPRGGGMSNGGGRNRGGGGRGR